METSLWCVCQLSRKVLSRFLGNRILSCHSGISIDVSLQVLTNPSEEEFPDSLKSAKMKCMMNHIVFENGEHTHKFHKQKSSFNILEVGDSMESSYKADIPGDPTAQSQF